MQETGRHGNERSRDVADTGEAELMEAAAALTTQSTPARCHLQVFTSILINTLSIFDVVIRYHLIHSCLLV